MPVSLPGFRGGGLGWGWQWGSFSRGWSSAALALPMWPLGLQGAQSPPPFSPAWEGGGSAGVQGALPNQKDPRHPEE